MAVEFTVFRQKDADLFTAFKRIKDECQPNEQTRASVQVAERLPGIEGELGAITDNAIVKIALASDSPLLKQATIILGHGTSISIRRDPDGTDHCVINHQDNVPAEQPLTVIASAKRHLRPFDRNQALDRLLGPELTEFYRRREESLLRLEELSQRLIQQNSEYRQKMDEETTELREHLQQENESARTELQSAHDTKEAALKERETALENRTRELDDRRSTHARRQIRMDLKEILANRGKDFSLTSGTARKRLPIHALFILLVATPGIVFLRSFIDFAWGNAPMDWPHLVRLPLSGIGLAAALIFYLRWNDQWFRQHAEEEFRLKQLDLDIDRASWVVEMALEWKDEKGTAIPTELVDRLTRNLFASEGGLDAVRHPAHDLASALLGASTGLNINIPGLGEAKLDRRGLKRFQKSAEEAGEA